MEAFWRPERPLTGVSGPSGPKIEKKKNLKKNRFGGGLQRSLRKYPTSLNWTLFGDFFCRPPKRLFLRFFCDFGAGGPGDSCKWSLGSQANMPIQNPEIPIGTEDHDSQRRDRIRHCLGDRAIWSTFWADFLTKLDRNLGK